MMKNIFFLLVFIISTNVYAEISLPVIFSEGMVLQRESKIAIWGWAKQNEKIVVKFHTQSVKTKADKYGNWKIYLQAEAAGGPYTLEVSGKNTIILSDVYVGDVWLCSGQSNMEMKIADWGFINNYKQEIANANYPKIRQFEVERSTNTKPQEKLVGGKWEVCNPKNAGNFSATAYFFARKLYQELNVPIGLINASWGGTNVETWISKSAFQSSGDFSQMIAKMPSLDLKQMLIHKDLEMKRKIKSLQSNFPLSTDDIKDFQTKPNLNYEVKTFSVSKTWENQGLEDFDGKVWYRKVIDVPNLNEFNEIYLNLGYVDDNDQVFVNGIKVGSSKGYNLQRKYAIDKKYFKEGKNIISVLVEDTGGGGGIYGDPELINLSLDNQLIDLSGNWETLIQDTAPITSMMDPNAYPSLLYNTMIHPITNYNIKGVIWYQGEANVYRAKQYQNAFPLLITDWRNQWKQGNFPFYFVQLSSWNEDNGNSAKGSMWAELREAQASALKLPNTGMAVTTDIGDAVDIHPKNKQDVGLRLAEIALNKTFNKQNVYTGPVYKSFKMQNNEIILDFDAMGKGLMTKDKYGYIKGFEIADSERNFEYVKAKIVGDKVVLYDFKTKSPVAIRYSWADDAGESNLFNVEGFPAAPFRTDHWEGITEDKKYDFSK